MFIHDVIKINYAKEGYLMNYPYHLISDSEMFDAFMCYRLEVPESEASKVIQGNYSLWESPKAYVSLYHLKSYEVIDDSDSHLLILEGNKDKLETFNQLSGLCLECYLSPDCYFSVNYPMLADSLKDEYLNLVEAINYHINTYLESALTADVIAIPDWVYSYMLGAVISVNSSQQDIHDMLVLLSLDNLDDEFNESILQSCLEISSKWISKLPPAKKVMRPPTMFGEPHVIKSLRIAGQLNDETPY